MNMTKTSIPAFSLAVFSLAFAFSASAETFNQVVSSLDDTGSGTLRSAIDMVASADDVVNITFDESLHNQTIYLSSPLKIKGTVNIDGAWRGLTIRGDGACRLFDFYSSSGRLRLDSLTLSNGYSSTGGGGVYVSSGNSCELRNCRIESCAANYGDAIYVAGYGKCVLRGCSIADNKNKGAINNDGQLTVFNSTFTNNRSTSSGGAAISQLDVVNSECRIYNCSFYGNQATYSGAKGGAVYVTKGKVAMAGCLAADNTAGSDVGNDFYLVSACVEDKVRHTYCVSAAGGFAADEISDLASSHNSVFGASSWGKYVEAKGVKHMAMMIEGSAHNAVKSQGLTYEASADYGCVKGYGADGSPVFTHGTEAAMAVKVNEDALGVVRAGADHKQANPEGVTMGAVQRKDYSQPLMVGTQEDGICTIYNRFSLREAIENAINGMGSAGGEYAITFDTAAMGLTDRTIRLDTTPGGSFQISDLTFYLDRLVIAAPDGYRLDFDGKGMAYSIFDIGMDNSVTFRNMDVHNFSPYGSAINVRNLSDATFENCSFKDIYSTSPYPYGAAVYIAAYRARFFNCAFDGVGSYGCFQGRGGAVSVNIGDGDRCVFDRVSFRNCVLNRGFGGAGYFDMYGNGRVVLANVTATGCSAENGGAFYFSGAGENYLINSTICGNSTMLASGGSVETRDNSVKLALVNSVLAYDYDSGITLQANNGLSGNPNVDCLASYIENWDDWDYKEALKPAGKCGGTYFGYCTLFQSSDELASKVVDGVEQWYLEPLADGWLAATGVAVRHNADWSAISYQYGDTQGVDVVGSGAAIELDHDQLGTSLANVAKNARSVGAVHVAVEPYEVKELDSLSARVTFDERMMGEGCPPVIGGREVTQVLVPADYRRDANEFIWYLFSYCDNLEAWEVAAGNPDFAAVDGVLYSADKKELIHFPWAKLAGTGFNVPNGVECIANCAFQDARLISTVTLPDSLKSIKAAAFNDSTLTSIAGGANVEEVVEDSQFSSTPFETNHIAIDPYCQIGKCLLKCNASGAVAIPDEIKQVWFSAFQDNTGITAVGIPAKFYEAGLEAAYFFGCNNIAAVAVADGNGLYKSKDGILYSADMKRLIYCPPMHTGDVVVPDGVEVIEDYAFYAWQYTGKVTLPDSLKKIGGCAFCDSNLQDVEGGDNVEDIGADAFYDTPYQNSLPSGFCILGSVLYGYKGTPEAELVIPGRVKTIGHGVFESVTGITKVTLPAGIRTINDYAFYCCSDLQTVVGGDSLRYVGADVFGGTKFFNNQPEGFVMLGKVVIGYSGTPPAELVVPSGAVTIGAMALAGQSAVESVLVPDSVQVVQKEAFAYCDNLKWVRFGAGVAELDGMVFDDSYSLQAISFAGNTAPVYTAEDSPGLFFGGMNPSEDVITYAKPGSTGWNVDAEGLWQQHPLVFAPGIPVVCKWKLGSSSGTLTNYYGNAVAFPSCTRAGYTVKWYDAETGGNEITSARKVDSFNGFTYYGRQTASRYPITYVLDGGVNDPLNPASYTVEGAVSLRAPTKDGYTFLGWSPAGAIAAGSTGAKTFTARWEKNTPDLFQAPDATPFAGNATYNGWLRNADDTLKGTLTVKAAKPKNGVSKLTIAYTPAGQKKQSLKGYTATVDGTGSASVFIRELGTTLLVGGGQIATADGSAQIAVDNSKSKDRAVKAATTAALARFQGVKAFALESANGHAAFSLTIDKKGKGKLAGVLPDGTKVSLSSQGLLGQDEHGAQLAIPFVLSKKASFALVFWVHSDGSLEVSDFTGVTLADRTVLPVTDIVCDAAGALPNGAARVLTTPTFTQTFTVDGKKWTFPKQNKRAPVDPNPYGTKMSFAPKTGIAKGSLSLPAPAGARPVKYTVNGVVVGTKFYGSASAKRQPSFAVTAE